MRMISFELQLEIRPIIDVDSYSYMDKSFKGVVTNIANTANDKISADAVTEFEVENSNIE